MGVTILDDGKILDASGAMTAGSTSTITGITDTTSILYDNAYPRSNALSNWGDTYTKTEMSFDIDGEIITFKGQDIKRLKEMLIKFIYENHPEDLL